MKFKLLLALILLFPSVAFSAQSAVWGWKNLGNEAVTYDGAANCISAINCPEEGMIQMGESDRSDAGAVSLDWISSTFYNDTFNRKFRFHIDDTVETAAKGKIVIYEDDLKVIEYDTDLISDATEAPYGDILFQIGQAEGTGTYQTGTAETVIGGYGTTTTIKFCMSSCNAVDACSTEICSDGGTEFADAGVGFYTPPYFITPYPDEFNSGTHTGEHYTLLQAVTKTSVYVILNTPHTFNGAGSHVSIDYGTTDQYGSTEALEIATDTLTGVMKIQLTGLTEDTEYHYRLRWKNADVDGSDLYGQDKTFSTLRPVSADVNFVVQADSHGLYAVDSNIRRSKRTMKKIKSYSPDFVIDLGDTQGGDLGGAFFQDQFDLRYAQQNGIFNFLDVPVQFEANGNHTAINQYYEATTAETILAFDGHFQPWRRAIYGGSSRLKYQANIDHGETVDPDYKTFASWESGNAVFICIDPYLYTTEYPQSCTDNNTFTLGGVQESWLANILATTTKKWKFIFLHQTLGGVSGVDDAVTELGCYGKGGVAAFSTGQNQSELLRYIKDPKHTVLFLGHDHMYAIEKYNGMYVLHVPSYGWWPASHTWNQNRYGYTDAHKFQGSSMNISTDQHGYFKAEILTVPVDVGDYLQLTYTNESGEEVFDQVPSGAFFNFHPQALTNLTRNKQVELDYSTGVSWSDAIDTTANTIKIDKDTYPPESIDGWIVGDTIGVLYMVPGFLNVSANSDKTVIEMIDIDGVPVPNSRIVIKD